MGSATILHAGMKHSETVFVRWKMPTHVGMKIRALSTTSSEIGSGIWRRACKGLVKTTSNVRSRAWKNLQRNIFPKVSQGHFTCTTSQEIFLQYLPLIGNTAW